MTKFYKTLICILGIGALLTGCQKAEQQVEDIDYSRVLTPLKFTSEVVASTGTDVVLSWQKMKNADGYELEIYEMLDDAEEVKPDSNGKLVGETYILDADEVPFTVYGLEVDKSFYARVRGISETILPSNWAYLEKTFSTSAVRASLNPRVTARTDSSVSLAWDNATDKTDLTSVLVEPVMGEGDASRVSVSPEEITSASKVIEGLDPAREYRFTLLFGKAGKRGSVTAFTRPSLDGVNTVYSAAELYNAINSQTAEVKVKLAYSEDGIDFTELYPNPKEKWVNITSDIYIYGQSTEEGKKPVISTLSFKLGSGAQTLHIEDLAFDGNGTGALTENASADMKTIEYVNCEISGYAKGIYSVGSSASGANVASFLVDNCYIHDINAAGTEGGDFIDVRNGANGDFMIRNSTFYACARTFFRISDNAKVENVLAENCTFNLATATNSSSNNAGIFAIRTVTGAKSIIARKNVFLNEISDGETQPDLTKKNADKSEPDASKCFVRLNRNSTDSYAVEVENNVYYNVSAAWWISSAVGAPNNAHNGKALSEYAAKWDWNGETEQYELTLLEEGGIILDSDPCVNSIAGKMYLAGTNGDKISSLKVGDPRWWDAVQPVIVREKELVVQADDYTWDFTEKTIYDTEELLENTIIGNARIFATSTVPANVVMSKGIKFSTSASVNPSTGIPSYSAVEVLTSGYGSVKVMADSEDGLGAVQVLVAGDRYPVLADGKLHTVNLGDLSGENSIYVLANNAVTLKKIVWTKDLTPDETVIVLAKPTLTMTPSKLDQGTEEDVVITWATVENAADYVLTWNGADNVLTETTYTIPASEVAALAVGEHKVSVIARPVPTSSKYVQSEVAEATLKINKVETGAPVTLTWDFSTAEWQAALEAQAAAAKGTDQTNWSVSYDDLTFNTVQKSKWHTDGYIQLGGASKVAENDRVFSFTAPAAGTLKVTASNTKSEDPSSRAVAVKVGDGKEQTGVSLTSTTKVECEFDIEAGEVKIYGTSGIRIYKIEFTYMASAQEDHLWDISSAEWQAALEAQAPSAKGADQTNWSVSYDDLTFNTVSKSKWHADGYIQLGGASKVADNDRVFSFTVGMAGTLKVTASNTKSEDPSSRAVAVKVGDGTEQKGVYLTSTTKVECEFDIEAGDVKVYGTSGIRIYKIEFHSN